MLAGENEHRDSFGNADVLRPGDVQWMTAGGGVIHAEMPTARFHREGGVQEGFQIWVNLPAADKMMTPRYQTLRADDIPQASSADGRVAVRVIAGESLGISARIDTRVPIQMLHFTVQPGGALLQSVPAEQNGLIYVFKGAARIGSERREVREGQAALLESGDSVEICRRCGGERRRRVAAAFRQAAERAGRALRSVRDEHARGDRAGVPRLPERKVRSDPGELARVAVLLQRVFLLSSGLRSMSLL